MATSANQAPIPTDDPRTAKRPMFVLDDGRNVLFTFILLIFLFALWGFCNGMIDVMDKHFQEELHLTLSQSAWVQFAHYLGYFLMAIPAGWLATRLGYKGGIITGLLMVAVGGFWFIPATHIAQFWAFLLGVCVIAAGLTFLETIANPYTTVLGPIEYAATRINLAQSTNGIGLLFGPIAGGAFFYSKNAAGLSTGSERLWIPYAFIGVVVILLAITFFFANVPDIKMEDDYHLDDAAPNVSHSIWSHPHFWMAVLAQFLYVAAQAGIFSFFINYMTSQVPPIPESWQVAQPRRLVRGSSWRARHQQQRRSEPGLVRLSLLSHRTFYRQRDPEEIFCAQSSRSVFGGERGALSLDLPQARLDLGRLRFSHLLLHVDHVPDHFRSRHFRFGRTREKASSFIVMAIMGGALLPESDGSGRRSLRSLTRIYRAAVLFRLRRGLWIFVAEAEWSRSDARRVDFKRALGRWTPVSTSITENLPATLDLPRWLANSVRKRKSIHARPSTIIAAKRVGCGTDILETRRLGKRRRNSINSSSASIAAAKILFRRAGVES